MTKYKVQAISMTDEEQEAWLREFAELCIDMYMQNQKGS